MGPVLHPNRRRPTSWQAIIKTSNIDDSYREFMLEFQDLQLAYCRTQSARNERKPEQDG